MNPEPKKELATPKQIRQALKWMDKVRHVERFAIRDRIKRELPVYTYHLR